MNAFKCDICKGFKEGSAKGTVTLAENLTAEPVEYECCRDCFDTIKTALKTPNMVGTDSQPARLVLR